MHVGLYSTSMFVCAPGVKEGSPGLFPLLYIPRWETDTGYSDRIRFTWMAFPAIVTWHRSIKSVQLKD